jgi:hypothetical protein
MKNTKKLQDILDQCSVRYNGEVVSYVNPKVLDKQNAWDRLDLIKELHLQRHQFRDEMSQTTNVETIQFYYDLLMEIESDLQRIWGFDRNPNYIKFWNMPHCTCPRYDNEDNYPHGPYVYNLECIVHRPRK